MKLWLIQQFQQSPTLYALWLAYRGRSPREQVMLMIAAVVLLLVLLIYTVWLPAQNKLSQAQKRYDYAVEDYQMLLVNADRLSSASSSQVSLVNRNLDELRRLVSQTTSRANLAADRISIEGDSRIQVWASDVAFATVAAWLQELAKERVLINSFQLERVADARVNLKFTLD